MWDAVLPPVGPLRRLAVVTLVDAVGTGLFLTVSVLFFTRVFSVAEVAVALSVAGFLAFAAAVPLGSCGDRFGYRRMWVLLYFVHAAGFVVYPFVRSFPVLVATMAVVALAEVGVSPARGAYLSLLAGPDRVRARAYNQAVTNAGFVVGAAGAAVVLGLGDGYAALLFANAGSYVVGAFVLMTLPRAAPVTRARAGGGVLRDRRYLLVSALNGLLMCYFAVLTVALPLWIVRTGAPRWSVGAFIVLNTVLVVLLQVRASRGAETVTGAAAAVRRAGWALLAACLVFAASGLVAPLALIAVGVVTLTAAELWHSAGAWGLSFGLAPADQQGQYLGAFAMGSRVYDTVGPGLVTGLALGLGPVGWVVLGVLFVVVALGLSAAARRVRGDARPHGDQHRDDGEPGQDEREHPETRVGEQPGHGEPPSTT